MVRTTLFLSLLSLAVVDVASATGVPKEPFLGHEGVGIHYPDAESREFLKAVLTALNVQFYEKEEAQGVTIYWHPSSKEQESEVMNRVSQYSFIRQACEGIPTPKPSDPAKTELSCTK